MQRDFRLGEWTVRSRRHIVENGSDSKRVTPKSMAVLDCLAAAAGEPVSRGDLFDAVWPGGEVSDDTLTQCVAELRKAFGDSARKSQVIETIHKVGFRLLPAVEPLEDTDSEKYSEGKRLILKRAGLLFASIIVIVTALLLNANSRLWLIEGGVTSALKAAAFLNPYSLEKKTGIAVLAFQNMSSDAENEYFSDGISEEILDALVKTRQMPVIARTSSFQFKGQNKDTREIGRLLGVTHLLEGSVRKFENRVRVTAQLIDTSTGTHLWSEVYDRELADIFRLQDEIANQIATQIGQAFEATEEGSLYGKIAVAEQISRGTTRMDAYEQLLRGRQLLSRDNPFEKEKSLAYFERAIDLDGDYVDAWVAKGHALLALAGPMNDLRIPAEAQLAAMAAFRTALKLEPDNAIAMGLLGHLLILQEYKWREGLQMMERSLELNPNSAVILSFYGGFLQNMRRENAPEFLERAYRLNPLDQGVILMRARSLAEQGRQLDAAALAETTLINNRGGYGANFFSAIYNNMLGRLDAAEASLRKAQQIVGADFPSMRMVESWIAWSRGDRELAWKLQEHVLNLAENHAVGLLAMWPWEKAEWAIRAWDIALQQRHPTVALSVFGPRPPLLPEANWRHIQEVTRTSEVRMGLATNLSARSTREQEQLLARAIQLSGAELDSLVGNYISEVGGLSIERIGGKLVLYGGAEIVPVAPKRFEMLVSKHEIHVVLEAGEIVGLISKGGQREIEWRRTQEQIH